MSELSQAFENGFFSELMVRRKFCIIRDAKDSFSVSILNHCLVKTSNIIDAVAEHEKIVFKVCTALYEEGKLLQDQADIFFSIVDPDLDLFYVDYYDRKIRLSVTTDIYIIDTGLEYIVVDGSALPIRLKHKDFTFLDMTSFIFSVIFDCAMTINRDINKHLYTSANQLVRNNSISPDLVDLHKRTRDLAFMGQLPKPNMFRPSDAHPVFRWDVAAGRETTAKLQEQQRPFKVPAEKARPKPSKAISVPSYVRAAADPKNSELTSRAGFSYPDIETSFCVDRNKDVEFKAIDIRVPGSYWWSCSKSSNHFWIASVLERAEEGCPFCSGRRMNLVETYPKIAARLHPTKNIPYLVDLFRSSFRDKVWWLCENGHETEAQIHSKLQNLSGCRVCAEETAKFKASKEGKNWTANTGIKCEETSPSSISDVIGKTVAAMTRQSC